MVLSLFFIIGCAGRDSLLTGGSSVGQLKTSLSHLQFDNEQLKTEVAKLKEDNRAMEDRLVQEQIHNGDLAARLDDARNLLRDRGIDSETRVGSRTRGARAADLDEEGGAQARTLPAGRTSRKLRKPPTASIPGDLDDLPTASDNEDGGNGTISFKTFSTTPQRRTFPDDSTRSSFDDDQLHWQPVATGADPQFPSRR